MARQRLEKSIPKGYTDVDRAADPNACVKIQDDIRRLNDARAGKERSFALMNLPKGGTALDLGCGPGDDARALAEIVGPKGRVVGVDISETMLEQARTRSEGQKLPVEFVQGDARKLQFPDDSFDAAHTERMLVHLQDPAEAIREMARVVRPGGRVVATEPDMGTWLVNHPDVALTRRIMTTACDAFMDGWAGRRLRGAFVRCGLLDVAVVADVILMTDPEVAKPIMNMDNYVQRTIEAGVLTKDEGESWLAQFEEVGRSGGFLAAVTQFTATGQVP